MAEGEFHLLADEAEADEDEVPVVAWGFTCRREAAVVDVGRLTFELVVEDAEDDDAIAGCTERRSHGGDARAEDDEEEEEEEDVDADEAVVEVGDRSEEAEDEEVDVDEEEAADADVSRAALGMSSADLFLFTTLGEEGEEDEKEAEPEASETIRSRPSLASSAADGAAAATSCVLRLFSLFFFFFLPLVFEDVILDSSSVRPYSCCAFSIWFVSSYM